MHQSIAQSAKEKARMYKTSNSGPRQLEAASSDTRMIGKKSKTLLNSSLLVEDVCLNRVLFEMLFVIITVTFFGI